MASPDPAPPPGADDIRAQLGRILASRGFASSPRLSSLLSFLVEESLTGHSGEIKESTVAVRVFGRKPDFDPRFDSIVRAQATQLRRKLREYYAGEGAADAVAIEMPTGGYVPVFRGLTAPEKPKTRRTWIWATVAGAVAAAALGVVGVNQWRRRAPSGPPSLAILPFQNFSGGADTDYFADGLVEDLTAALSRAPGLRVAARTSAFHFRGQPEDVRSIGRQLGVRAVLEGSVRRQGDRVKVTAQLIATGDGYHVWSNVYEGPVANLATVERDIVLAVSQALKLGSARPAVYSHVPPPDAYDTYLRARYIRGGVEQRRQESIPLFEKALRADPRFAAAWAALASTHAVMVFHGEGDVEAHRRAAHEAARKALELDETIPETHVALATLAYSRERNWASAERSFRRAVELNPSYAYAHRSYAVGLLSRGRFDDALAELGLARELDPMADAASMERATVLYCARRHDESMAAARQVLELRPRFYFARVLIGNNLSMTGRFAEASAEYEKAMKEAGRSGYLLARMAFSRAKQGRREEAVKLLREVERAKAAGRATELDLAWAHTALGDRFEAIRQMEMAEQTGEVDVNFVGVEPAYESLRAEPGFRALLIKLGLPER